eukprot:EG_transcript_45703
MPPPASVFIHLLWRAIPLRPQPGECIMNSSFITPKLWVVCAAGTLGPGLRFAKMAPSSQLSGERRGKTGTTLGAFGAGLGRQPTGKFRRSARGEQRRGGHMLRPCDGYSAASTSGQPCPWAQHR